MTTQQDNEFKVRLTSSSSEDGLTAQRRSVTFDVTPDLIENRNVNYKTIDPVHAPGQLYVYSNTSSRTFNLSNIRLISRTPQEASANLARLWTLRGWTMPTFGQSVNNNGRQGSSAEKSRLNSEATMTELINQLNRERANTPTKGDFLGAPPKVLLLSAYSSLSAANGTRGIGHIRRVPVVIQQLSIPYPSDVDYIPTADKQPTPMPSIMTLDMTLVETHSPSEYESFSLADFRTGNLKGF